jgi:hypothetical protein
MSIPFSNCSPRPRRRVAAFAVRGLLLGLAFAAVGLIVIGMLRSKPAPDVSADPLEAAPVQAGKAPSAPTFNRIRSTPVEQDNSEASSIPPNPATTSIAASPAVFEPTAENRQLVEALSRQGAAAGSLTEEAATKWKQNLEKLVQQGPNGVLAIREFLKKDLEIDFGSEGQKLLGYGSARRAMFDALAQIGGDEATGLIRDVLGNTAEPREVAALAKTLEQMAPGQYTQEALAATKQTLDLAASGKLQGYDVAPLFEVMQKMGGGDVVQELESATKQWNYYAAVSLSQLPEGAGLPSLIRMAQDPKGTGGSQNLAQQMLAQMAVQYPEAQEALLHQVRAGQVSPSTWPYLTRMLSGGQYSVRDAVFDTPPDPLAKGASTIRINSGNQNLQVTPWLDGAAPEQINSQIAFLDHLAAATHEPAALKAIDVSRQALTTALQQRAPAP